MGPNQKRAGWRTLVTFIGAGIILSTFVVKDVMKDKLKEVNDSLTTAENFYLTQTYNLFIQDDLVYIKQQVDLMLSALQGKEKGPIVGSEQALLAKAQASKDHVDVLIEYASNLVALTGKLHSEAEKDSQASDVFRQATQLSAEIDNLRGELPTIFAAINQNPNDRPAIEKLKKFVQDTDPIPGKTKSLMDETKGLTASVVLELTAKKKDGEQRYKCATTLSYILFGVGWSTSLVGQLLGLSGGETELES
jgi:hypothetical protein